MTKYDLDASLKHIFIGMHVLFIAGAAVFIRIGKNDFATFFAISSVLALIYYVIYQNGHLQTRMQAHLNLIEKAVKDSKEFREKVEVNSEKGEGTTPDMAEILAEKNVEEVRNYVTETIEDDKVEEYGGKKPFLKAVKKAEQEGHDRVSVKYFVNEKLLEIEGEKE